MLINHAPSTSQLVATPIAHMGRDWEKNREVKVNMAVSLQAEETERTGVQAALQGHSCILHPQQFRFCLKPTEASSHRVHADLSTEVKQQRWRHSPTVLVLHSVCDLFQVWRSNTVEPEVMVPVVCSSSSGGPGLQHSDVSMVPAVAGSTAGSDRLF
ncbi:hypothetical protein CRENBAI_013737 [Crenichthys baileyi]|uniref:Uncharacterized protein n=1 Tax=Crenichthys baileyi TaxID=28760 RepID=A0AAV9R1K1_9TELE